MHPLQTVVDQVLLALPRLQLATVTCSGHGAHSDYISQISPRYHVVYQSGGLKSPELLITAWQCDPAGQVSYPSPMSICSIAQLA
jgi:hypothetical protein